MLNLLVPKREDRGSLEDPSVPLSLALTGKELDGSIAVNRDTVLGYPAVWRAVNLIANAISKTPVHVFRVASDGSSQRDTNHPGEAFLRQPARFSDSFTFRNAVMSNALVTGNGYAWLIRDNAGRIIDAPILDPWSVDVEIRSRRLIYYVRIPSADGTFSGERLPFDPSSVLHIRGFGNDGLVGLGVVDVLREAFGVGMSAQRYAHRYFQSGARPGWIVQVPTRFKNVEEVEEFRRRLGLLHGGLGGNGRPAVVDNGAEIKPFPINHEDQQFLQSREFEAEQVANILGVPLHKVSSRGTRSHSSLEQETKSLLEESYDPWLVRWEQELGRKLLREDERDNETHKVQFVREALQQTDLKTTTESMIAELNAGGLTLNEYRDIKNRSGIGEEGDRFRMPLNMTFTDVIPDTIPDGSQNTPVVEETNSFDRALIYEVQTGAAQRQLARVMKRLVKTAHDRARTERWFEFCSELPGKFYSDLREQLRPPLITLSILEEGSTGALASHVQRSIEGLIEIELARPIVHRTNAIDGLLPKCDTILRDAIVNFRKGFNDEHERTRTA